MYVYLMNQCMRPIYSIQQAADTLNVSRSHLRRQLIALNINLKQTTKKYQTKLGAINKSRDISYAYLTQEQLYDLAQVMGLQIG